MAEAERHLRAGGFIEPQQHPQQLQGQRVIRLGSHLQHRFWLFQRRRIRRLQLYGSGNNVNCAPASIGGLNNSYISSPNGAGLILDLAWLPFSHGATALPYSTMNLRLGLQFTDYLHLYGGTNNFDGSYLGGSHNAQGNNSVFAYAWFAF